MVNNNYLKLIEKLINATKENRINWQQSTLDNEFIVEINGYSVSILYSSNSSFSINLDKTAACIITLTNEEGVKIDTYAISFNEEGYDAAIKLYNEAKKSYYKVDEVLRKLADLI